MNSNILHNLSKTLILHPIAGLLSFLAFLFGLLGVGAASRAATIMMAILSFFGALVGLVIFVIDMVLWNVLKNRLQDNGVTASLGNANWLTVGAVAAMILAMCASFFGACGRFATGRAAGEKVSHFVGPSEVSGCCSGGKGNAARLSPPSWRSDLAAHYQPWRLLFFC